MRLPGRTREREAEAPAEVARSPQDELVALIQQLRDAEARLADLEDDLIVLARREAELREEEVDVAIGTADPGRHDLAEAELEAEAAATRKRHDREQRVVEGLRSRCADLSEEIHRRAEGEIDDRLAGRGAEIEQHEARLAGLRAEQAADEQRLAEALEATRRSRVPFDHEAAKSTREHERQEDERIRSWARMPPWRLEVERLSRSTLAKIDAERARQASEREAARERDGELAAASWEEAGLAGTKPTFLEG